MVKLFSIIAKSRHAADFGKSLTAAQQLARRLLVYCSGLQVACMLGSRYRKRRLVQLATIKANCHVANTTLAPPRSQNATPPFVVFIILSLRFVSLGEAVDNH